MSKSERPTAAQVLAAVRLVHECGELGVDAAAWQRHLADGLRHLTGGRFATAGLMPLDPSRAATLATIEAVGEWPGADSERRYRRWLRDPAADADNHFADHPAMAAFVRRPEPTVAAVRAELVPDRDWERSAYVNDRLRPEGLDDGLVGRQPVAVAGGLFAVSATRFVRDKPFPRRAVRVTEVLQRELAPHLGRRLWVTTQPNLGGLTARQREVLDCLLDGDSEKQAARRLRLAAGTVHVHVKRLYRHFGVSSRAELLAHFLRRRR